MNEMTQADTEARNVTSEDRDFYDSLQDSIPSDLADRHGPGHDCPRCQA